MFSQFQDNKNHGGDSLSPISVQSHVPLPNCVRRNSRAQSGAALILALLVVVVVTLLANTLASDFLVTFRRVENQLLSQQAHAYLRGAEGLARSALQADYLLSKDKDHISEGWLNLTQEFPLDQGVISGTVCDLQGRFNLNSLASGSTAGSQDYTANQQMFIRLLQTLIVSDGELLDQQQAQEITSAIVDWIDIDDRVSANGGAENAYYADLDLPYRVANKALSSVSELRWIKGVDEKLLSALTPHVAVLPISTLLNVNTATINVIQSVNVLDDFQPISQQDAEEIIYKRDGDTTNQYQDNITSELEQLQETGFDNTSDFVAAHPAEVLDVSGMSVISGYFLLDSSTVFMGRKFRTFTVLYRDPENGHVSTIARANSGLGQCGQVVLGANS